MGKAPCLIRRGALRWLVWWLVDEDVVEEGVDSGEGLRVVCWDCRDDGFEGYGLVGDGWVVAGCLSDEFCDAVRDVGAELGGCCFGDDGVWAGVLVVGHTHTITRSHPRCTVVWVDSSSNQDICAAAEFISALTARAMPV